MKSCPQCNRVETDTALFFCRVDGARLVSASNDLEHATMTLPSRSDHLQTGEIQTSPSIAVLPFINVSADAENEYFCDGLAEELLNALAKIEQLKVAARTSSFSFKGKDVKVDEVARSLAVANVLEGSVRKSGERVRITVQLIKASDGYQLWSERYDRELRDIFDIQDEISLAIVEALKVNLLGEEKAQVLKRYTHNPQTYQLYLQARHQFFKLTPEGFQRSIQLCEQTIELDPNFAPAFAALGLAYGTMINFGVIAPAQGMRKMNAAVSRALELDDMLAEAHYAYAMIKFHNERNWIEAERGFKRAIEINPGFASARAQYGALLSVLGRNEEAIEQAERALELDPVGLVTHLDAGITYWFLGNAKQAGVLGERLLELEKHFFGGYVLLAFNAWMEGDHEKALKLLEPAIPLGLPSGMALPGCLYGIIGERQKAEAILNEMLERSSSQYVPASPISILYAGLGDFDRAFEWTERALERNESTQLGLIARLMPEVAADPRYNDILGRVGLVA